MKLNFKTHIVFYASIAMATLALFFKFQLPFFGDMAYISSVAHFIYEHDLQQLINPINDNGTPPLYSLYFASGWTIFGKSLWISHLLTWPFFIGLIWQFYVFSLRFVNQKTTELALILLLFDPTFTTQYLLMGYDIVLVFLFFLAVNSIHNKNHFLLIISTILIALINLRGFSLVLGIFLIDVFLQKKYSILNLLKSSFNYIPSALALGAWLWYHHHQSVWYLVSEGNTGIHGGQSWLWTAKNFVYEWIAFLGNGRFLVFLIALGILIWSFFIKKSIAAIKAPVIILILVILPFFLLFTSMAYPVGPRYFMVAYPLFYLTVAVLIFQFDKRSIRNGIVTGLSVLLLASNFWVNPYPYSNAWDSSLKILTYFPIQKDFVKEVEAQGIEPSSVYSTFPLHKNFNFTHVDTEMDFQMEEYDAEKIASGDYVVFSNIYNNLNLGKRPAAADYELIISKENWPSWLELYRKK